MKALIEIELDSRHLHKETMTLFDRLADYKCELKVMTDFIPLDFIDQQIDHYRQLFEESLYKNDDYDEKARMMVDSLNLLKRKWKDYERVHKD